jgi:hypothetical protein
MRKKGGDSGTTNQCCKELRPKKKKPGSMRKNMIGLGTLKLAGTIPFGCKNEKKQRKREMPQANKRLSVTRSHGTKRA